jgi:hypothetical protein
MDRLSSSLSGASRRLQISVIPMLLQESTPSEYQHAFAEIAQQRPDAIMVSDIGDLFPYRQLIVELIEKGRLPSIYGNREYVEAGGLMAYEGDVGEAGRRVADDVRQILKRNQGGRNPNLPVDQICSDHQSEGRQGAQPYHSAIAARGGRRGAGMNTLEIVPGLMLCRSGLFHRVSGIGTQEAYSRASRGSAYRGSAEGFVRLAEPPPMTL